MKAPKGLFVLLICIGLLLGYSAYAQEETSADQEVEMQDAGELQVEVEEQEEPAEQTQPEQDEQELVEQESEQSEEPAQEDESSAQEQPAEESADVESTVDTQQPEEAVQDAPQEDASAEQQPEQTQEGADAESAQGQPAEQPEESQEAPQEDVSAEQQPEQAQEGADAEPTTDTQPEEPEVVMPPDEIMGLDTVDLEDPQGNWLFKRVWWERSEQKIEKIHAVVTQIMEKRVGFFAKQAELDKQVLDPFYIDIGLKRGELTQKIDQMIRELKSQEKVHQSDTDKFDKLQQDKKELKSLALEVEKVTKQDEAIQKALLQLVDQINTLRGYEQQAWQDFKDIARVLDDKKARELFYKIDNAWQNVQKVQEYVEQTFTGSFDILVEDITKQIDRIKNDVDALKERGVLLDKQMGNQEDDDQDESDEQGEAPKQEALRAFFDSMISMARRAFNAVVALVRWPYDKIVHTNQQAHQAVQEREAMQEAVEDEDEQPPAAQQEESSEQPSSDAAVPMAAPESDVAPESSAQEPLTQQSEEPAELAQPQEQQVAPTEQESSRDDQGMLEEEEDMQPEQFDSE